MRNALGISGSLSLFLFAVAVSASSLPSSNDHLVTSLPGFKDSSGIKLGRNWAGYLPISENNDKNMLFYWLWEVESGAKEAPLIVWLNGGPGCSSMDGLFLENGPIKVSKIKADKKPSDGQLFEVKLNPYSWHYAANVMYIDQPVGTGFSFTKDQSFPNNLQEDSEQLWGFMQNFLRVHHEFVDRDIFLTGESYAGAYIPHFAKFCLEANSQFLKSGEYALPIKGAAIGSAFTDPYWQFAVTEYAFGAGLISKWQMQTLKEQEKLCHAALDSKIYDSKDCEKLFEKVRREADEPCVYDIRLYDSDSKLGGYPPGADLYAKYLNDAAVQYSIHVSNSNLVRFKECVDAPFDYLRKVEGKSQVEGVKMMLEKDIRVLLFAGQFDLICNHIGIENWVNHMEWSGAKDFQTTQRAVWKVDGKTAGYVQSGGGLDYILVKGAGHMVPMDVPEASLDLISRFIDGKTFADFTPNYISSKLQKSDWLAGESKESSETGESPQISPLKTESIHSCAEGRSSCVYKFVFFLLPGSMGGETVVNSILQEFSGRGNSSGLSYAHSIKDILVNDLSQAFNLPPSSVHIICFSIPSTEGLNGMQQSRVLVDTGITTLGNASLDTMASAWNDAHSALHTGVLTRNIDYSSPPSLQLSREITRSHSALARLSTSVL